MVWIIYCMKPVTTQELVDNANIRYYQYLGGMLNEVQGTKETIDKIY